MSLLRLPLAVVVALFPVQLLAQEWNSPRSAALVARGIAQRAKQQADSSLQDYRVRAHGFVFFLGQLGEGLAEPPRLIKSDELVLEVYWRTPDRSKQRIVGWRDRKDLPTDIAYHRDHLGIVQNMFGDRIRMGHGDEVQDVPHPLAAEGPELYEYALADSLTLGLPQRVVRVYEVLVRPRDFTAPRVVGNLYFDMDTAELVFFRFSFTRAAYLDDTLEDITVVLENGLWEGRYWLPRHQEIEIRRRTKFLDLPARGIIRGRWEIEDYEFNVGLANDLFLGPEIVAAPRAERDTFAWEVPLDAAIREVAAPVRAFDLEEVRGQVSEVAGANVLTGLASSRPSVGGLSDLLHFNRVEGLAPGLGWILRPGSKRTEVRVWGGVGLSDGRLKGRFRVAYGSGRWSVALLGARTLKDVGDELIISPALNSLMAQEAGKDFGDYYLSDRGLATVRRGFGTRGGISLTAGVERTTTVEVNTTPATGEFRENPPLGTGTWGVGVLTLERQSAELTVRGGVSGNLALEGGVGDSAQYARVRAAARAHAPVGRTALVVRAWGGWGSADLPPHRSFVLGGRGTLVGDPFRAWGGRHAVFGSVEWQLPVPFPAAPLGPFANTGRELVLAPYVSLGWAGSAIEGMPWRPSEGVRPVVGLGVEWFHRFFRLDVGWSPREKNVGLVLDVRRDLWDIL
ncbi:MAG: hypothetical protein JSW43_03575 [Gemmatimonadota bacterium]|nr:MAG: hypothetical protein JSW43_03575 [Gemmatimonadota bacterium]